MRRLLGLLLVAALLASPGVTRADDAPPHPASTSPEMQMEVSGFSDANTIVIRNHEAELRQRLSGLPGSKGIRVSVEFGEGGTLIKVEETVSLPVDGLELVPMVMGVKALDHRRGTVIATQVAAWVGIGPWREAMLSGNAPLAEALGQREIVVQFMNGSGAALLLPYGPGYNAQVQLASEVYVGTGKDARAVAVHPRDSSLGQPRGADGSLTNTARLYLWFGEKT